MKKTITRAVKKVLRIKSKELKAIAKDIKYFNEAKSANEAKAANIAEEEDQYEYRVNECIDEFFAEICMLTQEELKIVLPTFLKNRGYEDVIVEDGYIYAKGDIPIVLTAHMDTVHKNPVETYTEVISKDGLHAIYSPQGIGGDDRCGVYMILRIIEEHKCSVVFCEDEEKGCIGSRKFCNTDHINDLKNCKYMIGLDRAHSKDAVFYDCDNKEFIDFICENTGHKEAWGSYSDISHLAPAAGIAAVNLSCGYYHAHSESEYVVIEEMKETIDAVKYLIGVECGQFKYEEKKYSYRKNYDVNDDFDYDYYGGYNYYGNLANSSKDNAIVGVCAYFYDENKVENSVFGEGRNEMECWGYIFMENPDLCMSMIHDYDVY